MAQAKVAHRTPGRIRLKLSGIASPKEIDQLIEDLKVSPEISKVTLRGSSLIIEHSTEDGPTTELGKQLNKLFPGFQHFSDDFDDQMSKTASDPWMNKMIPLGFLGLAVYTGISNGAVLAGESAFALGYVAFDLYWKFQQENVTRKIQKGLASKDTPSLQ